jgi:hypothetical protein
VASSPELRVTLLGRTQSIVTRNLQTTRTFVYQYTVTALRAGKATLGPAELRVKGQPVVAQALAMEVREREARAKSALQARASLGEIEEGLKAWVGQTLVYHFSFRHRESLADARWTPPEFPGLSPEPLTQQAQRQYDLLNEGARVTVHDIDIPLVVTSQGSFDVPPGILSAQLLVPSTRRRSRGGFESVFESLGGLAETRSETVASNALRWQARPLPVEGRPEAFAGPVRRRPSRWETPPRSRSRSAGTAASQGRGCLLRPRVPPSASTTISLS